VKSSIETWCTIEYGSPSAKYVDATHGTERPERRSSVGASAAGISGAGREGSVEGADFEGIKAMGGGAT
jgi:hypothetical protein